MDTKTIPQLQDSLLYSYRIASADLKYIEINTREIYLRMDTETGPMLRGELPECGPTCYGTLSEIFLEHAMSCKGCEDGEALRASMTQFGERLAEKVTTAFKVLSAEQDIIPLIFDCVAASMGVQYHLKIENGRRTYSFSAPPLEISAEKLGMHLYIDPAHAGLFAFFYRLLSAARSDWVLLEPKPGNIQFLQSISIKTSV